MIILAGGFLFTSQHFFPQKEELPQKEVIIQQEPEAQNKLMLSFPINGTNGSLDGEVLINNQFQGITKQGEFTLENISQFPKNITLRIKKFEINYEILEEFQNLNAIHLIVSREEYEKYQKYDALQQQDAFAKAQPEHWNHMPLKYLTNFSDYKDSTTRESKELKVKYALERLHNAVPSISFQRVTTESEADITFIGEIPREIREANRPDGNFNIAGLALHNVTGNIIFKGTVYIPLPTEGEECPSADIALHELLHTFSLPHSSNVESVLWDTSSCTNNKIIAEDIALLKGIYG